MANKSKKQLIAIAERAIDALRSSIFDLRKSYNAMLGSKTPAAQDRKS